MSRAPSASLNGRRPTATSTTSHSSSLVLPSDSNVTRTLPSFTAACRAVVHKRKVMPCFSKDFLSCSPIPRSMPGTIRSMNSANSTCDPSRFHTEPSSKPMAPAPTIKSRGGTCEKLSASVDETIDLPSNGSPGNSIGALPVAMRMRRPRRVWRPAPFATSTASAAVMRAVPVNRSTLFLRNSPATPCVSTFTTRSFRAIMAARSISTLPTLMPCAAKPWRTVRYCSLESSSALLGMQPTLRQVPPSVAALSTQPTRIPSCAARMAAT